MPNLKAPDEGLTDFYFVEVNEPEAIQDLIVRLVKERIPARFGVDPKTDIQVLSPMNRSQLGARNLNQVLQAALNPGDGGPEIQRFGWTFRIGDRVIQTENDYNRDVFNGDLGMRRRSDKVPHRCSDKLPHRLTACGAASSLCGDAAMTSGGRGC